MENRIAELRKAAGLTQQALAAALGVSRQTIISLENGRYNPTLILAWQISRFFSSRIEDVFLFEKEGK